MKNILILANSNVMQLLFASAILCGLIIILAIFVFWVRKRTKGSSDSFSGDPMGFSLHKLEKMRDSGDISTEEFKKLRRKILGINEKS